MNQYGNFDKGLTCLRNLEQMLGATVDPRDQNMEILAGSFEDPAPPESASLLLLSMLQRLERHETAANAQRALGTLKQANFDKFAEFARQFQGSDFPFSERLSAIAAKTRSLAGELDWIMEALGKPKMCKMDARYHEAASQFLNLVSSDLVKFESEYNTLQRLVDSIQMPSKETLYLNEQKLEKFFQQMNQSINNILRFQRRFTELLEKASS